MLNKWLVNLTKYITTHITSSNYFLSIVKSITRTQSLSITLIKGLIRLFSFPHLCFLEDKKKEMIEIR